MLSWYRSSPLLVALALFACGDDGGSADGQDADAAVGEDDAGGARPDGGGGAWQELVTGTWSLPTPGTESYWCARLTVDEDMWISGLRAIAPHGTHHTVLTVSDGGGADGETGCSAGVNEDAMLYASGVGTEAYAFPAGVAVKVEAGQQLLLNLHLYNATDGPLEGVSGVEVQTVPEADVEQIAEFVFAGTFAINIPDDGLDHDESGSCRFQHDATVLSIWPHMHQLGTHMKVEHQGVTLHDEDFTFTEQRNYVIEPVVVKAGETLDVTCTWSNPPGPNDPSDPEDTGGPIGFGDSSDREMCFAGFYRYPAEPDPFLFCT